MGRIALAALVVSVAFIALSRSGPARGQVDEALTVQIAGVDASSYPALTATVNVLDATQRPVLGLDAGAFVATLDGETLPVAGLASAEDSGLGIAVVLTFDVSGSMEGAALGGAKEAGKSLISQLGPADQAAVLAFSNSVVTVQALTQDKVALTTAIDGLFASGNTALYSAVFASTEAIQTPSAPRRAVVLLSDGVDFGGVSQVDAPGSLAAAQASGVPFFVVGLGDSVDQPYLSARDGIAGQLLLAPEPAALDALYQNIGESCGSSTCLRSTHRRSRLWPSHATSPFPDWPGQDRPQEQWTSRWRLPRLRRQRKRRQRPRRWWPVEERRMMARRPGLWLSSRLRRVVEALGWWSWRTLGTGAAGSAPRWTPGHRRRRERFKRRCTRRSGLRFRRRPRGRM
jgi:hypothetical protein